MKRKIELFMCNIMIKFYEKLHRRCFIYKRHYKKFYKWLAHKCEVNALVYKIKYLSWYYYG